VAFRNPLRTLPVSAIYGDFPAARISGQLLSDQIAALDAAKINGQLTSDQIAALDAAKINGQLTSAQIASVAAGKVTGTLTNAQIDAIDAAKVTGQLSAAQIAAVNAVAISGKLTAAQITSLAAGQITGTLTATQIAAVSAAAITGQLAGTQLAANSIDGKSINGATITGGTIQTATTGQRWQMKSTGANTLWAFTGDASEYSTAGLIISTDSANLLLTLQGPGGMGNATNPAVIMSCPKTGSALNTMTLLADQVKVSGTIDDGSVLKTETSSIFTVATGWTLTSLRLQKFGPVVWCNLSLTYNGATVSVPADGNIANQTAGTFDAQYRPISYGTMTTTNGGYGAFWYVNASGTTAITALVPGASMTTGTTFVCGGMWMAPTVAA